jgi:energy-coupling factor transporter ATP-binding protein EcfA2
MILKKFSCTFVNHVPKLEVGKNASGKSMLVSFINFLAKNRYPSNSFSWSFTYEDETGVTEYIVDIHITGLIEKESLIHNGETYIDRSGDTASIYSVATKGLEAISPPMNEFVIFSRRDAKAYPYIENIIKWAEGIHFFRFGHVHPNSFAGHQNEDKSLTSIPDFHKVIGNLTADDFIRITANANSIGFKINTLYTIRDGERNTLYMQEEGINTPVSQYYFSQGMFRAITLIIFIYYLVEKVGAGMIIVDDLCEGMDYERASKLGKYIYETLESKNIQFIATSNDSFLMNVVDIKYWNILHREGNHIHSYNISNSKEKFDSFKKSGLNNFDLFSSDFL